MVGPSELPADKLLRTIYRESEKNYDFSFPTLTFNLILEKKIQKCKFKHNLKTKNKHIFCNLFLLPYSLYYSPKKGEKEREIGPECLC